MARVLIFDDQEDWAEQMALSLSPSEHVIVAGSQDWGKHVASTSWDAIVVDVQILGSDDTGPEIVAKSIPRYRIATPVIVVSGIVKLDGVREKYGNLFFDYIHKDDCGRQLPVAVESACSPKELQRHLPLMLEKAASDRGVLDAEFPPDNLTHVVAGFAGSAGARTVRDLIGIVQGNNPPLTRICQEVLVVIDDLDPRRA